MNDLRSPPHDELAEQSVLGSVMLDARRLDDVALLVRPSDFYDQRHGALYQALLDLHETGGRVDDLVLLNRFISDNGHAGRIGGLDYLAIVADTVPTASHAEHYASIVRDQATLRAMILAGGDIVRIAHSDGAPREKLAKAEQALFGILNDRATHQQQAFGDVLADALAEIDRRLKDGLPAGIPTGFIDLDDMTGGMRGGHLIIVAARPSMGKSAFATNVAEHVSYTLQKHVLFVSLEMARLELADRMLCSRAKVDAKLAQNGRLTQEQRREIAKQVALFGNAKMAIDDTPGRNMTEIAAQARRAKRRNELDLLIVDYLQIIEPDDHRNPRQEQVSAISRRLKGVARELSVPVLCVAQINRQVESQSDKRPRMSHLRESGAIEQDADGVWFVHRDEYYAVTDEERQRCAGTAEIVVAKQRGGATGNVDLCWFPTLTRFENKVKAWSDHERPSYAGGTPFNADDWGENGYRKATSKRR